MTTICLIRHGRTEANARKLYCGSTDVPLSADGIAQLRELREAGGYPMCDAQMVYTSDMLRARQTLEILYGISEHAALTDFREMDFGAFEMRSYEEMKREPAYLHWIADQTGEVACPGGESAAQFKARMFRAFDALVSNGEDALVICHGGAISNIMARLFPHENRHFYEWQPAFGHGYAIVCSNGSAVSYHAIPNSTGTQ